MKWVLAFDNPEELLCVVWVDRKVETYPPFVKLKFLITNRPVDEVRGGLKLIAFKILDGQRYPVTISK